MSIDESPNKHITRLVNFVTKEPLKARQILERSLSIYGISFIYLVLKLRKLSKTGQLLQLNYVLLSKVTSNASSVAILFSLYPVIKKFVNNKAFAWNSTVFLALRVYSGELPNSLISYVSLESIYDGIKKIPRLQNLVSNTSETTLILMRQCALCTLVPIIHCICSREKSTIARLLFGSRSFFKDFLYFYCTWNFLSLYKFVKSALYRRKEFKNRRSNNVSEETHSGDESDSTNSKALIDRLREINELTSTGTKISKLERIASCSVGRNLPICIKWTVWRQLVQFLFSNRSTKCSAVQKSVLLLLCFLVLNGNDYMNVRFGVLKYLLRCIINEKLNGFKNLKKLILLTASNLAFYNISQKW